MSEIKFVRNFFCDVFIKSLSDKERKLSKNKPSEIFSSEILSSTRIPLVNLDYWCSMDIKDIKAIVEEDFSIPPY